MESREKISNLIERINRQPGFKNAWLQLIDVEGTSVYRSWTENIYDNLLFMRPELSEILKNPEPKKATSVGLFALSFKSMVPVFDDHNKLLGIVDMVTRFTPMTIQLNAENNVSSVLLVDDVYHDRLTRVDPNSFIKGYYVANTDARPELLDILKEQDLEQLLQFTRYTEIAGYVVGKMPLYDETGTLLGHWLTFNLKSEMSFQHADWVLQKYIVLNFLAILLLLLITLQYINNRQTKSDKLYFRQIIDSVSDIVYISNNRKIVDCNQHFFELFDEFDSLKEFLKVYRCVCETFVKEAGFIQQKIDNVYWLDYILQRPNEVHKAKIIRHGQTYIFQLKVKEMQGTKETLYNVLMQDITQVEVYKDRLQKLAVTDELTGVGNRAACNQALSLEVQRAQRYNIDFSVVMLDIDHFKFVNDQYGHDVGDVVLRVVANTIQKTLREMDVLCRYGGEEFLVLLPESDKQAAFQTAERLRLAVKALTLSEVPMPITISLGVATLASWDTDLTFVKRADQALYRAKDKGRDCTELDGSIYNQQLVLDE